MGTRGLKVYRFRKRYYAFYNHYDSYPEGLGKTIVGEIPKDAAEYKVWLSNERAKVAEWAAQWEKFITYDISEIKGAPSKERANGDGLKSKGIPKDIQALEQYPSFLAPLNDVWIEWVYTLDLDNETFTVSNSAHFALEQMPHIEWMASLGQSSSGYRIILPGVLSEGAVVDLIAKDDSSLDLVASQMKGLDVSDRVDDKTVPLRLTSVAPKSLESIPWHLRHQAMLGALIFYFWTQAKQDALAATLLQLTPEDLLFREIAYALLCVTAGGKYVSCVPTDSIKHRAAIAFIQSQALKPTNHSEMLSVFASGAHLEGEEAGSAPKETTYWLNDVLVVLVAQLYDAGVVDKELQNLTQYCNSHQPGDVIDAVLISIEHVVLVHMVPGTDGKDTEVQHTELLPLINIEEHLTMRTTDRYTSAYLSKLAGDDDERFKKRQQRKRRDAGTAMAAKTEGINISYGDKDDKSEQEEEEEERLYPTQVEGSILSTYYGLHHLFSAAANRRLSPTESSKQGVFPTEIYGHIISHVTDRETRDSCLHSSRLFRELTLENFMFSEAYADGTGGAILRKCEATEECVEVNEVPKWWNMVDLTSKEETKVDLKFTPPNPLFGRPAGGNSFSVIVGDGKRMRSLLDGTDFAFHEYKGTED